MNENEITWTEEELRAKIDRALGIIENFAPGLSKNEAFLDIFLDCFDS